MAYTKTTFVNGQAPAVSAEELNKIGQGVLDAHNMIDNKVVIGTYTGDLPENTAGAKTITLGFRPKAILVSSSKKAFMDDSGTSPRAFSAFAIDGSPHFGGGSGTDKMLEITATGFIVYNYGGSWFYLNSNTQTYNYMAVR